MEMIVASTSATILLAGLASSIFVVSQAFDNTDAETAGRLDASLAANEILTDLRFATTFTERSTTAVTFEVPDRDGDGENETLRYAWDGTSGSPLTRALNGSTPEAILEDVSSLNLEYVTRTLSGLEAPIVVVPEVSYADFIATRQTQSNNTIKFKPPGSSAAGDLMVLAIALDGKVASDLKQPLPGWTLVGLDVQGESVALGVWWRIADGSEPKAGYSLQVGSTTKYFTSIMRFTGHDPDQPITAVETLRGSSFLAQVPAAEVDTNNSMLLRIGAFQGDSVNPDSPGASGHEIITVDEVGDYSAAAAYQDKAQVGTAASTFFELDSLQSYVTATIVIRPDTEAP